MNGKLKKDAGKVGSTFCKAVFSQICLIRSKLGNLLIGKVYIVWANFCFYVILSNKVATDFINLRISNNPAEFHPN